LIYNVNYLESYFEKFHHALNVVWIMRNYRW